MPFTKMERNRNRLGGENESFILDILSLKHPWDSQMEISRMRQALQLWSSEEKSRLEIALGQEILFLVVKGLGPKSQCNLIVT